MSSISAPVASPLASMYDIYETIVRVSAIAQANAIKKFWLRRLLTKSPAAIFPGIRQLGDQLALLDALCRDHSNEAFAAMAPARTAKVYKDELLEPLIQLTYLLSTDLKKNTKKKDRRELVAMIRRLVTQISNIGETFRLNGRLGFDSVGGPSQLLFRTQHLITRLQRVERNWS